MCGELPQNELSIMQRVSPADGRELSTLAPIEASGSDAPVVVDQAICRGPSPRIMQAWSRDRSALGPDIPAASVANTGASSRPLMGLSVGHR